MRPLTILIALALFAAPLTGCIANMDDLKDRLQRSATDEPEDVIDGLDENLTNESKPSFKPPVARITVYGEDGALVYKATFAAENQTDPVIVDRGNLSLLAGDSEVLEANATLESFAWTVNGEAHEGRQVTVPITDAGVYMIVLTITDSNGESDDQMIHLGVMPEPFTETLTLTGGQVAGADAASPAIGTEETLTFPVLAEKDGKSLTVQQVKVTVSADNPTADTILIVTNPEGTPLTQDSHGVQAVDGPESLTLSSGSAGDWGVTLRMYAGATPGWTATIEITYVEVVEGLGDGGHGGHAH